MGKYTIYQDIWVDQCIQDQLDKIVNIVLSKIDNVISIILSGSFGRGEGSVLIKENQVIPLKDYDILVVVKNKPNASIQEKIYENIYKSLNMKNAYSMPFLFQEFAVTIDYRRPKDLFYDNALNVLELKNSSFVLHGIDLRDKIDVTLNDISLYEGIEYLLRKFIGLTCLFDSNYLSGVIPKSARIPLIYESQKAYVEICTVLCLIGDIYDYSYVGRLSNLRKNYRNIFEQLSSEIPDLVDKIHRATEFKLKPDFSAVNDPIKLWFTVRHDLEKVVRYYLSRIYNFRIIDWLTASKDLERELAVNYVSSGTVRSLLHRYPKLNLPIIRKSLMFVYGVFRNIKYINKLRKIYNKIFFAPLSGSSQRPFNKLMCISPLVILSLNPDGSENKIYLNKARNALKKLMPIQDSDTTWNSVRKYFRDAEKLIEV